MAFVHTHTDDPHPHVHTGQPTPHAADEMPHPGEPEVKAHRHSEEDTLPHRHPEAEPVIRFDDFCFAYDDEATLRHIDLAIYPGDSAVLMGYNGSGKSTLLKAINGLIFPQQGAYYFDGQQVDAKRMKDARFAKRLHQRVGFIFQDSDAQLFCSNVEEEIAFGPRQMGLSEEEVARRVDDACRLLDIEKLRARAPYHLSGGEKKKVAIACVLSMNPDVYCFDEPLNGLDIKTRDWLYGFLKALKTSGKTLIVSTHDQSLADALADYFIYMGEQHEYSDMPHIHINR
ncbi:MAG: energy-coupling factor ABC transporter ATP-binding protein [Eggerthellaceae bacterium]|jgi:cobalt/nickel transport system ATP-binding protein